MGVLVLVEGLILVEGGRGKVPGRGVVFFEVRRRLGCSVYRGGRL